MTKHQIIIVISAIVLTGVLYFAVDNKPKKISAGEQSEHAGQADVNFDKIIKSLKDSINAQSLKEIEQTEDNLKQATSDSIKVEKLKSLASIWYKEGQALVSGYYAEQIAIKENTAESWQIAGTTYRAAIQQGSDDNLKTLSSQRAASSLEKAIALDTTNITNKIQLAMVYVDKPLQENPMKGILMLRDLNDKYPDQPAVILQLGQLAMRTGQFDKAIERFKKAVALLPEQSNIYCMLAEAYAGKGDKAAADAAVKKCKK